MGVCAWTARTYIKDDTPIFLKIGQPVSGICIVQAGVDVFFTVEFCGTEGVGIG